MLIAFYEMERRGSLITLTLVYSVLNERKNKFKVRFHPKTIAIYVVGCYSSRCLHVC